MESFKKLFKYLGVGGAVALIAITLLLVFLVGPFLLILGLNWMGFEVEYTMGAFFGAALVILALRAGGVPKKKNNE